MEKRDYSTYEGYVREVFIEDHNCKGMDIEEALDIFNKQPFEKIEKWLGKQGYDLKEMYETDFPQTMNN